MKTKRENKRRRGAIMVGAILLVLVLSLVLAGVASVTVAHFNRAKVDSEYASAIYLADAGINYELRRISLDPSDSTLPDQAGAPYTGSIAGVDGTFTVYVTNEDGSSPWVAPNAMVIHSTGTVNNIARKVTIRGTKKSIFDEYAIFAVHSNPTPAALTFQGNGSIINGSIGTNGVVAWGSPTNHVNGDVTLAGPGASGASGPNVYTEPDPIQWPTVDEIANAAFPGGGLAWLRTNHNNGNLMQFTSTASTIDDTTSAGFPTTGDQQYRLTTSFFDRLSRGPVGTPTEGVRTLIFTPGDYYFESVQVDRSVGIIIDNRAGRVRIWINTPPGGGGGEDYIKSPVHYLDPTPSKFRLYYNKCSLLTVEGSTQYYGGFYAWREGCSPTSPPSLRFAGSSTVFGSVIGGAITVAGGTVVSFPNEGAGADVDDFSLWFGFKDSWKEVIAPGTETLYPDGTNK